jgi:2-polyprenyl-6-methoxyphenol hydroxylase-like FAD-dependent oxidoreductase
MQRRPVGSTPICSGGRGARPVRPATLARRAANVEHLDGVIVSGAGPVGLLTALVLARAGVPVTVLEAEPAILESPRAIVYHSPTVALLDRLDLLADAAARGVLKQDYQFRTPEGTILARLDMAVIAGDTDHPYNLHLGQHLLAQITLDHLQRTGRADVRWNHRVAAVSQGRDRVSVVAETPDGPRDLAAPWLVGADGARSGVRQALGLDLEGMTWPERFVAINLGYDFEAHGYARANFVLDPDEWAIIPILDRSGLWRVTYGEDAALPEDAVPARVDGRLRRVLPGGGSYELERVAPYRVHQRAVHSFRVGRVLLAGDAAHVTNPCGGLGLTSGLLDAIHLGDALAAVVVHGATGAVLDGYASERRRIFREVTSPTATENKRRLAERDPERRRADRERLRRLDADPELQREALLVPEQLVSRPYSHAA